jgi:hypothetical protein
MASWLLFTLRYAYDCCIYDLSPWCMASVALMHNLSKMMVIPGSAGDATLISSRWQLIAPACIHDLKNIL